MSDASKRPVIVISYAHADEPEKPAGGQEKWLTFVRQFLLPAEERGVFEVWVDRLMEGGADWEREIERKLRACDIFVLLVSAHSMASDYVNREIAIFRERQVRGEPVHFYPLLLTPTPRAGLDKVRDRNLRPRDAKPLSGYGLNDREQHMTDAANEIAAIAESIAGQRRATPLAVATAAVPGAKSDRHAAFEVYHKDNRNPVGRCAELIPGASKVSTYERFDLLPELRCGTERIPVGSIQFSFGITQIELRLKLDGCEITPGARLGDNPHPFIRAEGRNTWIITGPMDENDVLSRRVLGDDVLCSINPFVNGRYNIVIEVGCLQSYISYNLVANNKRKLNINKETILGAFMSQCLGSNNGFVILCVADFDVLEIQHET